MGSGREERSGERDLDRGKSSVEGTARKHNRRTRDEEIRSRDFESSQASKSDHRPPKSGILRSLWMLHLAGGVCLACMALGGFGVLIVILEDNVEDVASAGSAFDEDEESIPVLTLNMSPESFRI